MRKSAITRISRFTSDPPNESGLALLVVIAILTALLTMGATFALLMRMERRSAINLSAAEEARVDARNRLEGVIQVLESNRGDDYDALHNDTEWFRIADQDPNLTIFDLDSRFNVNAMGQIDEILGDELFFMQRVSSFDTWMSRAIEAALREAEADPDVEFDMEVADIPVFAMLLADMIVRARYGEDGLPGEPGENTYYGDLEHRLGYIWDDWSIDDDDGVSLDGDGLEWYPNEDSPLGASDEIPNAARGPDGQAYFEPGVEFRDYDPVRDWHFNPEDPIGDDQPFSSFWQVIPIIERALDTHYGVDDGPDYYTQVIEALEPSLGIHSHTRSPDYIDINAAIPERMRITDVSDYSIEVDRDTPLAVDSLIGRKVRIIEGNGQGEERVVRFNNGNIIEVAEAWDSGADRPSAGSICIVVADWAPYENPYNRLYNELGLLDWVNGDSAARREPAARLLANLIDFKDADDIPTRIDIVGDVAYGPGWNAGGGVTVYGAEGVHITEIMATPAQISVTGNECVDDGDENNANPPSGEFWDWMGDFWVQREEDEIWGSWEFTGLKDGVYAIRIFGGMGQTLRVRTGGEGLHEYNVTTNLGPQDGLYYGYYRDGGDALVPVEVAGGMLEIEIQGAENDRFYTIQLLPTFIEITNIAKHALTRAAPHNINIAGWTLRAGSGGNTEDFSIPNLPDYNTIPAVRPDGEYPIEYGFYIVALSESIYEEQWYNILDGANVVLFPIGDYGANRAEKDQNADWLVDNLYNGDLTVELREPNFGLVAGGAIDGAEGLNPLEYIAHQKRDVLGSTWQSYGGYSSSDDTDSLVASQNVPLGLEQVVESGSVFVPPGPRPPIYLNVNPAHFNWATNQWAGDRVRIVSGPGAGQQRTIVSNESSRLRVSPAWHAPRPNNASNFEIVRPSDIRTWLNEQYIELWENPGEELKESSDLAGDGLVLPLVLNRPYHSRGWLGLVPSGAPWRTVDPAPAPNFMRNGPEDLLGLLMSRTRTSGSYARINVNTASAAVLRGLFDDPLADWFVDERPWTSWDALLNEAGLQDFFMTASDYPGAGTYADDYPNNPDMREEWFRRFGDLVDIRSSAFLIRAKGTDATGEATAVIEAVVDRQRDTTGDGYANCSIVEFRYVTEPD